MISFRLSIHNQDEFGDVDWNYVPAWSYDLSDEPDKYPIRANIYQCKELPPADDNGTSDPYVTIWSPFKANDTEKKMIRTRVVNDNNNPIFYNTVESFFYSVDYDWSPPVVLEIYDKDSGTFSSDDFIGRSVIFLDESEDCIARGDERPTPKWFPVKLGFRKDEPVMGQILVSFNILDPGERFSQSLYSIKLAPPTDDYEITINVLGMRNLESPGILPVRKAFINFMLRSLLPPHKAQAVENISTQPSATGSNPTISTVVKFKLSLPNEALYCPSLTCGVYDYIFKGISQPTIGNFVIPIGDLQHLQDDNFIKADEKTKDIIKSIHSKINSAEEEKKELERKRLEAQREREQEEDMKKGIKDKQEQKLRQELAAKGNMNLFQKAMILKNKSSGYKALGDNEDNADIEMGVIDTHEMDGSHEMEESKEERKENALFPIQHEEDEEDKDDQSNKADEKNEAKELINSKNERKTILKEKRTIRLKKMFRQMKLVGKNVVYPTYQYDDRLQIHRESIPPPKEVFMPVGYDPKHDSKQKHYRRFYEDELENIKEVMPKSPFQTYDIIRGQSRGISSGWFSKNAVDEAGEASTVKTVGKFKGIVSVINHQRAESFKQVRKTRIMILKESLNSLSRALFNEDFEFNYDDLNTAEGKELFTAKLHQIGCDELQIEKHFTEMNYQEELARLMMVRTPCIVRVYILDADELPPKDIGGSVDPYLVLKLNGKVLNERSNYISNCHNPEFNKMFEFHSEFPGSGLLKIQLWDYDRIFGDDFIGETLVDLEDRFFSPEWQSIKNKPVEFRQLYHKSTKVSQGVVKCWIEIIPAEAQMNSIPWNITPRPPSDFEVRVVVWETSGIETMDWEGTSDIYCRAYFDSVDKSKRTDIHYRCMTGKGSFNYRLKFNISHPSKDHILNLQVWDADAFSKNDFIGDTQLNLILPIEDAALTNKPISLNKRYYESFLRDYMNGDPLLFDDDESFWIDLKDKRGQQNGKLKVKIDIVPKEHAESFIVGDGRSEPNHSPYLPPPVGRIVWSLNPWTMLNQCVAPGARNKVICAICCILCLVIFFLLLPNIMGEVIAGIIV